MFNDLNNPTNQNRQAVDDIFAETDKPQENQSGAASSAPRAAGGAEIDTQRIGLAATDELTESAPARKGQDKIFKIIIILIAVAVLGLGGYLVYSKFLNAPVTTEPAVTATQRTGTDSTAKTPATVAPSSQTPGSFVEATGNTVATSAPAAATTTVTTTVPVSSVDSDSDGLTDAEEKAAGTNINIIDTDNDGLSDYEEVKIYKTNPLSADTDGDGYLDGAEVKGGYNPNGAGKLSAVSAATTSPAIK
jgi:flagellar basal body-associated protein FliL